MMFDSIQLEIRPIICRVERRFDCLRPPRIGEAGRGVLRSLRFCVRSTMARPHYMPLKGRLFPDSRVILEPRQESARREPRLRAHEELVESRQRPP